MTTLKNKVLFITGASRGIGLAIALRAARDGARVVVAAKTTVPHPKLAGTIHSAAEAIRAAGGEALAVAVDVRSEESVQAAMTAAVAAFGGIDIVVNNASAIALLGTEALDMKRYDLMHSINARGTFLVSKLAIPYLRKSNNPHVLMMAPPLDMNPAHFKPYTAYAMAKYGMSMVVLGLAEEFRGEGIAFNALWPRTTIATAAIEFAGGGRDVMRASRKSEIMADAAHAILTRSAGTFSGNFCIDDSILFESGVRDFDVYRNDPAVPLQPDIFVPADSVLPPGVAATMTAMPRILT